MLPSFFRVLMDAPHNAPTLRGADPAGGAEESDSGGSTRKAEPSYGYADLQDVLRTAGGNQLVACPLAKGTLATQSLDSMFDDFLVRF